MDAVWIFVVVVLIGFAGWLVIRAWRARHGWIKWPGSVLSGIVTLLLLTVLVLGLLPIPPNVAPVPTPGLAGAQGPTPATFQPTDTQHNLIIHPGESIQAVIDQAIPGDTVVVMPGVYHEALKVNVVNLTLLGEPDANGQWPILDGQGQMDTAVLATANFFTVEQFQIRNYTGNGVKTDNIYGAYYHNLFITNPGQYGVFPVQNTHVVIQNVKVSGAKDAGIYVGQSRDVLVEFSEASHNNGGIEIESCVNSEVLNNDVHDNTLGILVWNSPEEDVFAKEGRNTKVINNRVENNNSATIATEEFLQSIPPGIGILVFMTGPTEVARNTISGNDSAGVGVAQASIIFNDTSKFTVPLIPEQTWLHDNQYANNGNHPAGFIVQAHFPGADILWDVSSWDNRFDDRGVKTFPPLVPTSAWPDLFKRSLFQVYQFLK